MITKDLLYQYHYNNIRNLNCFEKELNDDLKIQFVFADDNGELLFIILKLSFNDKKFEFFYDDYVNDLIIIEQTALNLFNEISKFACVSVYVNLI